MSYLLNSRQKKRILERIDSEGESRFIPQRKIMWWWLSYKSYPCGEVEFYDFEKCKDWLIYERDVIQRIHAI